jgi:hypothetical protein
MPAIEGGSWGWFAAGSIIPSYLELPSEVEVRLVGRDLGVTGVHDDGRQLQSERRLVKKPAASYRFLALISFMGLLTATLKEIKACWKREINEPFLINWP